MTTVVGLDLSLVGAGLAVIDHPRIASTPNVPFVTTVKSVNLGDHITSRAKRVNQQFGRIWRELSRLKIALVVVEDLPQAFNITKSALYQDRSALYMLTVGALDQAGIPVTAVGIGTLKKFATGDGHAEKSQVIDAMTALWPGAAIGRDDNRADALTGATMGAQHLKWYLPEAEHHHDPNVADWISGKARP